MRRVLLSMLCLIAACQSESSRRAQYPDDQRVRSDVRTHLAETFHLVLPDEAIDVQFACTAMNSQCGFTVGVYPEDSGLLTHFLLWPRYVQAEGGLQLAGIDDNLRTQIARAPIADRLEQVFIGEDATLATLRGDEFNGYVAIKDALPTDIAELRRLNADTLLAEHGTDIGLDLHVYVFAEPAAFEAKARAAVARLLADPSLHLGKGYDIRWHFRTDPPKRNPSGRILLENAPNRWLPETSIDNTRASWRLRLGGTRFGDDLRQPVDLLWAQLEREDSVSE